MFDLIAIGDTVIDTYVPIKDAKVEVLDGQRMLELRLGDKIAVDPLLSIVGGNAANVAVSCARLKLKTGVYTHLGNDHNKHLIISQFKNEGVDMRYLSESQKFPTDQHVILNYKDDRTILVYHQPWDYTLPDLESCKWIYFTSLSPSFPETNIVSQLTQYLERTGTKLTFNPGTFQIKYGIKKSPKLLSLTEVFVVNKEEAKLVLGHNETDKISPKKLLKGLADLGPRTVVITDGTGGSYGFDGQKYYQLEKFPAKVVQMTGAGDAYSSALTSALLHGKEFPEAMRWGAANGAAVVEKIGPEEGLLTYSRLQELLKQHKNLIPKEI